MEIGHPSSNEHEGRLLKCHQYHLTLPAPTNLWVEVGVANPGIPETDVLLFICRVNDKEELTDVITYMQHKVDTVRM